MLKGTVAAKLVFVRDRREKGWLALLSTYIDLADEEIIRIYGKRRDIEDFFKMAVSEAGERDTVPGFRCRYECRVAVCWLVKEQFTGRLNPDPES